MKYILVKIKKSIALIPSVNEKGICSYHTLKVGESIETMEINQIAQNLIRQRIIIARESGKILKSDEVDESTVDTSTTPDAPQVNVNNVGGKDDVPPPVVPPTPANVDKPEEKKPDIPPVDPPKVDKPEDKKDDSPPASMDDKKDEVLPVDSPKDADKPEGEVAEGEIKDGDKPADVVNDKDESSDATKSNENTPDQPPQSGNKKNKKG